MALSGQAYPSICIARIQTCPCCGGELHLIGETISEMLDHVPARLRVIRICRPRFRAAGRIAELYAIETTVRGQTAAARQRVRQSKSLPLVAATKPWLNMQLNQIPPRSSLADAICYTLTRWGHPLPLPQ